MALNFSPLSLNGPTQYEQRSPLIEALLKGQMLGRQMQEDPENLLKLKLANEYEKYRNQFAPRAMEADVSGKELSNVHQGILNQFLPESEKQRIAYQILINKYYGPKAESELSTSALNRQKLRQDIANYGMSDEMKNLLYSSKNPELVKLLEQNQQSQQSNKPSYEQVLKLPRGETLPGEYGNRMSLAPGVMETLAQGQNPEQLVPTKPSGNPVTKLLLDKINTDMQAKQSLAQQRQSALSGTGKYATQQQKHRDEFKRALKIQNPNWDDDMLDQATSAYIAGDNEVNGIQLPPLKGEASDALGNIYKQNSDAALRNQYSQISTLTKDLKEFPIDTVAKFAGPQGKAKLKIAQAKMVMNPNDPSIDPEARQYLAAMKSAIINMDSMRKAFGTSVVPDYVYKTIGELTNPNASIWQDSKQVKLAYKTVVDQIEMNKKLLEGKVKHGVTYEGNEKSSNNEVEADWGRDENGKPIRIK